MARTFSKLATIAAALVATGLLAAKPPVAAEAPTSVYTTFDAKSCRHFKGKDAEDYGSWDCPGYQGRKVLLSAGDQRMFVSFGARKSGGDALSETFPGFNDVYRGTVEWRMEPRPEGRGRPFATILSWNVMRGADRETGDRSSGRVLVVTRLGPGGTCHVGYVDSRMNRDANALARRIADTRARSFRCGVDRPTTLGARDTNLAMP